MFEYDFLDDFSPLQIERELRGTKGKYTPVLEEWLSTPTKALKLSLKSNEERRKCRCAIAHYCKKHDYDWTMYNEKNTYNLYIVRG